MPTLRKVEPEIAQTWESASSKARSEDAHYAWVSQPATLYITQSRYPRNTPILGDVLRITMPEGETTKPAIGVVIDIQSQSEGHLSALQLAMAEGGERWITKQEIAQWLGRLKGISRIDQPRKMIHGKVHGGTRGWFVRLYKGTKPFMTCSFSDSSAGSRRAALRAALAYHAAHVNLDVSEGIPFL